MQIISHSGCQNTDGWLRAEGKFNLTRHATLQKQGIGIHIAKKQGIGIHIAIPTSRTGTVSVTAWRTSAPPNPAPINLIRGRARNIQIDDGPPPPLPTPPPPPSLPLSLPPPDPTIRWNMSCLVLFLAVQFLSTWTVYRTFPPHPTPPELAVERAVGRTRIKWPGGGGNGATERNGTESGRSSSSIDQSLEVDIDSGQSFKSASSGRVKTREERLEIR